MASLGLPGLAGFWGEFPAILSAYNPARRPQRQQLFRVYMVIGAIGTVFAAGYLLWLYQRVAFGTPQEEFARRPAHPRRHLHRVAGLDADARRCIVVLGFFPNLIFDVTDPAVHRRRWSPSAGWGADAAVLAQLDAVRRGTAPSLDFHAFAPEIVLVGHASSLLMLVDLFGGERTSAGRQSSLAGIGLLAACIPVVTLAYDGDDRLAVRRRLRRRRLRPGAQGAVPLAGYVVVLLSTNYIAEGDYWEGEYYQLILLRRCSA